MILCNEKAVKLKKPVFFRKNVVLKNMNLETLLQRFADVYCNRTKIEYDATYGSVLVMDDDLLEVRVEPNEDEAWFHCPIFDIPKNKREKIYEMLLTSQLFGKLTRGAHFSLNISEQKILLCKNIKIENIMQEDFDHVLREFFETCLLYKANLKDFA